MDSLTIGIIIGGGLGAFALGWIFSVQITFIKRLFDMV